LQLHVKLVCPEQVMRFLHEHATYNMSRPHLKKARWAQPAVSATIMNMLDALPEEAVPNIPALAGLRRSRRLLARLRQINEPTLLTHTEPG
jgi:hypothetical protein